MTHPAISAATGADRLTVARAVVEALGEEERREISAAEAEVRRLQSLLRLAEARVATAHRLNTYSLRVTAEMRDTTAPGPVREARALLLFPAVDTIARRERALQIAHTGQNLGLWGRWSEAVHYAAQDLARMISEGREGEEHYTERAAREDRERQEAARAVETLRLRAEHGTL